MPIRQLIFELDDNAKIMRWIGREKFSKLELAGIAAYLDECSRYEFWPEENNAEAKQEESPDANQS